MIINNLITLMSSPIDWSMQAGAIWLAGFFILAGTVSLIVAATVK